MLVIADVLCERPTGDVVLGWRIRELLGRGVLEGRGDENRMGLPEEILAAKTIPEANAATDPR